MEQDTGTNDQPAVQQLPASHFTSEISRQRKLNIFENLW